jgi:hypothetical protein
MQERLFPVLRKEPFVFGTPAEDGCGAVDSGVCSTEGKLTIMIGI